MLVFSLQARCVMLTVGRSGLMLSAALAMSSLLLPAPTVTLLPSLAVATFMSVTLELLAKPSLQVS